MKVRRQTKIIELIRNNEIETQEELGEMLTRAGFNVTQATISRDIRELKLTKVPSESGRQKYGLMQSREAGMDRKYVRVIKDAVISMDKAGNILVIKTVSGMAMAVAAAIDSLDVDEIAGCIAGDDTVFCAIRNSGEMEDVIKRILKLQNSQV